jgi:hypothetical protein
MVGLNLFLQTRPLSLRHGVYKGRRTQAREDCSFQRESVAWKKQAHGYETSYK